MEHDQKRAEEIKKILLLGTGDSGKSTVFKQMQIIANEPFEEHIPPMMRLVIRRNIVLTLHELIDAVEGKVESSLQKTADHVDRVDDLDDDFWTPQLCASVKKLWTESKILRNLADNRDKLQFPENSKHFLNEIDRVGAEGFVPTVEDILRARTKTIGITHRVFRFNGATFEFTDVGGQRNERRKWIDCFNGVTAVIFVVAISEYNQVLYEDAKMCRMQEALNEFRKIANHKAFEEAGMILFLNKIDLLEDTLKKYSFKGRFGYEGPDDPSQVREYIKSLFLGQVNGVRGKVYPHYTCALDTNNITRVFNDCQKTVFSSNLSALGFI